MSEYQMDVAVVSTIVSALCGLLGAVLGAWVTWRTMRWQTLREEKRSACTEVFNKAMQFLNSPTLQNQAILIAALYNARLLFSKDSAPAEALRQLCTMSGADKIEPLLCKEKLNEFWNAISVEFDKSVKTDTDHHFTDMLNKLRQKAK